MEIPFLKEKKKLIAAICIIYLAVILLSSILIPILKYNYLRLGYGLNLLFIFLSQLFFLLPLIFACFGIDLGAKIEIIFRILGTICIVLFFAILVYIERYIDKDLTDITSSSETLLDNSTFIFLACIVAVVKIASSIFVKKDKPSKRYELFSYAGMVCLALVSLSSAFMLDAASGNFVSPITFLYIPNILFILGYGLGRIGFIYEKKIKYAFPLVFVAFVFFAVLGFLI